MSGMLFAFFLMTTAAAASSAGKFQADELCTNFTYSCACEKWDQIYLKKMNEMTCLREDVSNGIDPPCSDAVYWLCPKLSVCMRCRIGSYCEYCTIDKEIYPSCTDVSVIVPRTSWGAINPRSTMNVSIPVEHVFIGHTGTPMFWDKEENPSLMRSLKRNLMHHKAYVQPPALDDNEEMSRLMRSLQRNHMHTEGCPDIGYNFVIGSNGRVYEGTGWFSQGVHLSGFNSNSYIIGIIGNFMNTAPTKKMLCAAKYIIATGVERGYIMPHLELHGERDATSTASPGDSLYDIIRQWKRFKGGPLSDYY